MPLYMDVHNLPGATSQAVAEAHMKDLQVQGKHDVKYLRYWVDEAQGKVFCLVEAPNAEAAHSVHPEAHGLVAVQVQGNARITLLPQLYKVSQSTSKPTTTNSPVIATNIHSGGCSTPSMPSPAPTSALWLR